MAPKKPDCKWHKGTPENSRLRGRPGENRGDFFVERVIADLHFSCHLLEGNSIVRQSREAETP
jgi:hypothetical protein